MTLDELIQEWFDQKVNLINEFGSTGEVVPAHRRACLVAVDLGAQPPALDPFYFDYFDEDQAEAAFFTNQPVQEDTP